MVSIWLAPKKRRHQKRVKERKQETDSSKGWTSGMEGMLSFDGKTEHKKGCRQIALRQPLSLHQFQLVQIVLFSKGNSAQLRRSR